MHIIQLIPSCKQMLVCLNKFNNHNIHLWKKKWHIRFFEKSPISLMNRGFLALSSCVIPQRKTSFFPDNKKNNNSIFMKLIFFCILQMTITLIKKKKLKILLRNTGLKSVAEWHVAEWHSVAEWQNNKNLNVTTWIFTRFWYYGYIIEYYVFLSIPLTSVLDLWPNFCHINILHLISNHTSKL